MKNRATEILEQFDHFSDESAGQIKLALQTKLSTLGLEGIMVDKVYFDFYGNTFIDMVDLEDSLMTVSFCYDAHDGFSAIVLDDFGNDYVVIDLDSLGVSAVHSTYGSYVNMSDLSWLNKSTLLTILKAGEFSTPIDPAVLKQDAFGNNLGQKAEGKSVSQGGKKRRLPIVGEKNKSQLNYGQRMAVAHRESSHRGKKRVKALAISPKR